MSVGNVGTPSVTNGTDPVNTENTVSKINKPTVSGSGVETVSYTEGSGAVDNPNTDTILKLKQIENIWQIADINKLSSEQRDSFAKEGSGLFDGAFAYLDEQLENTKETDKAIENFKNAAEDAKTGAENVVKTAENVAKEAESAENANVMEAIPLRHKNEDVLFEKFNLRYFAEFYWADVWDMPFFMLLIIMHKILQNFCKFGKAVCRFMAR